MELRASDADREQAVERLRTAAMEGRLDSEELEQRVQTAYAARFCTELSALTADVTPPPAMVPPSPVPVRPTFVAPTPATNGFAIASLVCSVIWFGWLGSFLAVIFGHVALRQIRETGGVQRGRGLAIAGLIIGYFAIVTVFAVFLAMFVGM
jgi:hypothetical protein